MKRGTRITVLLILFSVIPFISAQATITSDGLMTTANRGAEEAPLSVVIAWLLFLAIAFVAGILSLRWSERKLIARHKERFTKRLIGWSVFMIVVMDATFGWAQSGFIPRSFSERNYSEPESTWALWAVPTLFVLFFALLILYCRYGDKLESNRNGGENDVV